MPMRRIALILALIVSLVAQPVIASNALTDRVNATWGTRIVDQNAIELAQMRSVQITTDFSHNGVPDGYAEVIAWNQERTDPIGTLVTQWLNSPPHNVILSDPRYDRIGCATTVVESRTYGVCLLPWRSAPVSAPVAPVPTPAPVVPAATPAPVPALPDTAYT